MPAEQREAGSAASGRPRFPDSIVGKVAAHLCGLEG
jgi:hypothetical protein